MEPIAKVATIARSVSMPTYRAPSGEFDTARLREIGCRPEAIRVLGNMKFDAAKFDKPGEIDVTAMLRQLGVPPDAPILLGGSTHAGEELILAQMAGRLRARFPKLFLVLVPRHHERCKEVGRELRAHGITFIYRREISAATQHRDGEVRCLLVDTTGELRSFYEHATVVFVGKSLTASGGQNPIEPGTLGKAMVFGPKCAARLNWRKWWRDCWPARNFARRWVATRSGSSAKISARWNARRK